MSLVWKLKDFSVFLRKILTFYKSESILWLRFLILARERERERARACDWLVTAPLFPSRAKNVSLYECSSGHVSNDTFEDFFFLFLFLYTSFHCVAMSMCTTNNNRAICWLVNADDDWVLKILHTHPSDWVQTIAVRNWPFQVRQFCMICFG